MTVQPPIGVTPRRRPRLSAPHPIASGLIKMFTLSGAIAGWAMLVLFVSGAAPFGQRSADSPSGASQQALAAAPADHLQATESEGSFTGAAARPAAYAQPVLRGRSGDTPAFSAGDRAELEQGLERGRRQAQYQAQYQETAAHGLGETGFEPHVARRPADRLAPAPIEGLYETNIDGAALPVVADDGRTPLQAYARLSQAHMDQPRLGVMITGLGLDPALTADAILSTPPETTLSFVSDAPSLGEWIAAARAAGHETVLELAMEPHSYPLVDPGPYTLLANASKGENRRRLLAQLGAGPGYCALRMRHGEKFADRPERAAGPFQEIADRGLGLILDAALPKAGALTQAAAQGRLPTAMAHTLDQWSGQTAPAPGLYAVPASPESVASLQAWTQLAREQGLSPAPACSFIAPQAGAAG